VPETNTTSTLPPTKPSLTQVSKKKLMSRFARIDDVVVPKPIVAIQIYVSFCDGSLHHTIACPLNPTANDVIPSPPITRCLRVCLALILLIIICIVLSIVHRFRRSIHISCLLLLQGCRASLSRDSSITGDSFLMRPSPRGAVAQRGREHQYTQSYRKRFNILFLLFKNFLEGVVHGEPDFDSRTFICPTFSFLFSMPISASTRGGTGRNVFAANS
jgi:hypothetical protein